MTPDLQEDGSKRREAYLAKQSSSYSADGSGGQAAFGRVVGDDVDTAHGGILYVDDITVSFDGFRALNKLTLNIAVGVAAAFVPALAWMRCVTRTDDQRFRQIFVAARLRVHDRNRRFWQARSYAPHLYLGARDACHA